MKPSAAERLKDIERYLSNPLALTLSEEEAQWLVHRVKTLEAALTYYEKHAAWCLEKPGVNKDNFAQSPFIAEHGNVARKALEGE